MAESFGSQALILKRDDWRESDSRVVLYTKNFGKIVLVARGVKKMKSKLAGHIEPFNLVDMMILKGKSLDYLGSAITRHSYFNLKNDLNALYFSGQAISLFNNLVKEGLPDEELFYFLTSWLELLDEKSNTVLSKEEGELLYNYFAIRLMTLLGYKPELYHCTLCHQKVKEENNSLNLRLGGLIDASCLAEQQLKYLPQEIVKISNDAIKVLRLFSEKEQFPNIKINPELLREIGRVVKLVVEFS
jgi:DNA repair protein RecO (recombination protein O)